MNVVNVLNNCSNGFKKLSDLTLLEPYQVIKFKKMNTRFGEAVLVELKEVGDVILPKRFSRLCDSLDDLNKFIDVYMVVLGKREGHDFLHIEFRTEN